MGAGEGRGGGWGAFLSETSEDGEDQEKASTGINSRREPALPWATLS